MPYLVEQGQDPLVIHIASSPFTIGRGVQSTFILTRDTISREHATFRQVGTDWMVRNHSRTNPISINQAVVLTERRIAPGDRIWLGSSTFVFSNSKPSEEEAPQVATTPYSGRDSNDGPAILSGVVNAQAGAAGVLSVVNNYALSGRLVLRGEQEASVWLDRGLIIQIRAGNLRDAEAIPCLANWDFSHFVVMRVNLPAKTMGDDWSFTRVMLEVGRLYDGRQRHISSTKSIQR